jgi:glycosyltransferase involved in cell wall biosynthesis
LWPLALPLIPYMRANLARKRRDLGAADALIPVSSAIAADLRLRAPELAGTRVEVIPTPTDVAAVRDAAKGSRPPLPVPYAIYVGKLARNKGVQHLLPAVDRARLPWPLVVVGDGPERASLEREAGERGRDVRFTGWLSRDAALGWLAHASLLVFPSHGPESLSRVLVEAGALAVPVAAMNTGGTRDIVVAGSTGLLSATPEQLGEDVARLVCDEGLRRRLGAAAAVHVERTFDAATVVERVERLYEELRRRSRGVV